MDADAGRHRDGKCARAGVSQFATTFHSLHRHDTVSSWQISGTSYGE